MSDTTTDTSSIDDKKTTNNTSTLNIKGFVVSMVMVVICILAYFSSASAVLYMCKIGQSNVLPSDIQCAPYETAVPTVEPKSINIFEEGDKSSKLEFPYEMNSKNKLLDWFREYKQKPNSHFLANYFITIAESVLHFNYSSANSIFHALNETLSESVLVGTGPFLFLFLYAFGMIANNVYFIYIWFSSMYWFFRTNSTTHEEETPKWENVSMFLNPINWSMGVGLVCLFSWILILVLILGIGLSVPAILFHNALISILCYKSVFNKQPTPTGLMTIVKEVFVQYKVSIVVVLSICMILLSFSNLGTIPGICSLVMTVLIYHGTIHMNVFQETNDIVKTPMTDYKQATKSSCLKPTTKGAPMSLLKQLIYAVFNIKQKGGGNDLTHQMKQIHKEYSINSPSPSL